MHLPNILYVGHGIIIADLIMHHFTSVVVLQRHSVTIKKTFILIAISKIMKLLVLTGRIGVLMKFLVVTLFHC